MLKTMTIYIDNNDFYYLFQIAVYKPDDMNHN